MARFERKAVSPPAPVLDPKRLAALDAYDILDTPAEAGFDDIVRITASICDTPVALVSLVAADRQWFKARVGFDAEQTDLDRSVCAHALTVPDLLVIPDLTQDARTRHNPLVTDEPRIRFYAGAPLRTPEGHVIGSLCAIDGAPRPAGLSESQATALRSLARVVIDRLELRRAIRERDVLLGEREQAEVRRLGLLTLVDRLRDLETAEEMIEAAAGIVGEALNLQRVGYGRLEDDGATIVVDTDWTAPGIASLAGRHRLADLGAFAADIERGGPIVIEDVASDPRTARNPGPLVGLGVRAMVKMCIQERGKSVALLFVHAAEPRAWPPEVLAFLRNVADRLDVGIARVMAEADQRVLNEELSHRMKNTFAMVQAIAGQTLRAIPDQAPVEAFTKRILALSTAHDVLLRQTWAAARIGEVVRGVLGTVQRSERFDVSGPEINIGPRATLSLSLLIYELSTNAFKHGALSAEEGRVAVSWRIEPGPGPGEVVLDWKESGGPATRPPEQRGFGSRLIRMGLVGTGGVELRYLPAGLEVEFRAPLDQVQHS